MEENEIKIRRSETQEFLKKIPGFFSNSGTYVLAIIAGIYLALGFIIKYPDKIAAEASISPETYIYHLVAPITGYIRLLKQENANVATEEVIGYVESRTPYESYLLVKTFFINTNEIDYKSISSHLESIRDRDLGEFQALVSALQNNLTNHLFANTKELKDFPNEIPVYTIESLRAKRISLLEIRQKLYAQLELEKRNFHRDSMLFANDLISKKEYENVVPQRIIGVKSNLAQLDIQLNDVSFEEEKHLKQLQNAAMDRKRNLSQIKNTMQQDLNALKGAITDFENKYFVKSKTTGVVNFTDYRMDNAFVREGDLIGNVTPYDNSVLVTAKIPENNIEKIKMSDKVEIVVENSREYGRTKLSAKVIEISKFPVQGFFNIRISVENSELARKNVDLSKLRTAIVNIYINNTSVITRLFKKIIP